MAGDESTWQERATIAEQQALQQQLDEERKAREELARQVGKLLQESQHKGKGHE